VDVDLRKLRYFVALAEELHYGRAAEALHIAQPVLSRQIKALEDELKVQLFVRTKRATELTPAGEQLLADARPLLANAEALRRRVARGTGKFTVGFMPGLIVTGPVRALRERHPELAVEVVRTAWHTQVSMVHDGQLDVSYVRLPVDQRGLRVRPVHTEQRVAVVRTDHPLAGKESVDIGDLTGEHLLQASAAVPEWPGSAESKPPLMVEVKLELVASGSGVVILPLSTATFYTRPDVTYVPITDIGPSQICVAWDAARHDPIIDEFADLASAYAPA
jgi:DNA-binding transcriptional LysR family regulator